MKPWRRRLEELDRIIPPRSYVQDDMCPIPDPATMARILGNLFNVLGDDRERFAAFVRDRAPEISHDELTVITDEAARCARADYVSPRLELIRGGRDEARKQRKATKDHPGGRRSLRNGEAPPAGD